MVDSQIESRRARIAQKAICRAWESHSEGFPLRAAKTDCKAAATQINVTTIMGIELFEIRIAVCTAWIIALEMLRVFRENR